MILPAELMTRGDCYVEWLTKLEFDLALAKRFAKRNPMFAADVKVTERAIQILHDSWPFEALMPNLDFYKQEINDAHRTIRVDGDGPIPQLRPVDDGAPTDHQGR